MDSKSRFSKKIVFMACLLTTYAYSQGYPDALKYSMNRNVGGSARYRAMSGAFVALGGDFSAMSSNPAGSAVFSNSQAGLSLNYAMVQSRTNYFDSNQSRGASLFNVKQIGGIVVLNNPKKDQLINRVTFGVNYDNQSDYLSNIRAEGNSPYGLDDYYLWYANYGDKELRVLEVPQNVSVTSAYLNVAERYGYGYEQAFFAYQGNVINPESATDTNTRYTTNAYHPNGVLQRHSISESGSQGATAFNLGMRIRKNLYVGVNLNYKFFTQSVSRGTLDRNFAATSIISSINYQDNVYTSANGFSFQIGGIYKIKSNLRVGISYQSPVYYRVLQNSNMRLETVREDNRSITTINPNVNLNYNYRFQSPSEVSIGAAFLFKQKGLISLQYNIKNYSGVRFNTGGFESQNSAARALLGVSHGIRLGGEYKVIKNLSVRAGARYETSPYKNNLFSQDYYVGDLTGYSLGVGYEFYGILLDLAYDGFLYDGSNRLYAENDAFKQTYNYSVNVNNISLGVRFLF